ncbi:hypothetical protein [Tautonia marina]|uniref:hypothetical protein n=1 Tax=Tautonia marina TaxID=2653855 RepID=UPI00137628CB|nr:hypothetical protein [Tautonia marina]
MIGALVVRSFYSVAIVFVVLIPYYITVHVYPAPQKWLGNVTASGFLLFVTAIWFLMFGTPIWIVSFLVLTFLRIPSSVGEKAKRKR